MTLCRSGTIFTGLITTTASIFATNVASTKKSDLRYETGKH